MCGGSEDNRSRRMARRRILSASNASPCRQWPGESVADPTGQVEIIRAKAFDILTWRRKGGIAIGQCHIANFRNVNRIIRMVIVLNRASPRVERKLVARNQFHWHHFSHYDIGSSRRQFGELRQPFDVRRHERTLLVALVTQTAPSAWRAASSHCQWRYAISAAALPGITRAVDDVARNIRRI